MGVLTTKAEMAEQLLTQFQAGLERGLAMISGHGLRFTPPSAPGAGRNLIVPSLAVRLPVASQGLQGVWVHSLYSFT